MKKILVLAAIMLNVAAVFAQDVDPESKYIRNSLYMIRLDMPIEDASDQEAMKSLNAGIDGINWEERYKRYNSVGLSETSFDWTTLPAVSQDEIDAVKKESDVEKTIRETVSQLLEEQGIKSSSITEGEYGARLLKYFKEKKFGNQLVAKWFVAQGASTENVTAWDDQQYMINTYGYKGLSTEALEEAKKAENIIDAASSVEAIDKLLNNTYICVNRFGYMSAQEVIANVTAPMQIALVKLPAIAQAAAQKGIDKVIEKTKGYFICCNSYLFKLKWNGTNDFYTTYWNNPTEFMSKANFEMEYVGHTSKRISCVTLKSDADQNLLMAAAALKGSDKCIAALQKEYESFRPMSSLHVVDGKLAAYVGTKEGVTAKSQFDVFSPVEGKSGVVEWEKVGSVKVDSKSGVWDNAEKVEGEGEDEDAAEGNAELTCTFFKEKPNKKMGEGCMIKLVK